MEVSIPTHKEIYMVYYLTFHGWEPNYSYNIWTKKDFERKVWDYYDGKEFTTGEFSLEEAYWAQKEKEE